MAFFCADRYDTHITLINPFRRAVFTSERVNMNSTAAPSLINYDSSSSSSVRHHHHHH